ncbi:MAG: hypothetical protein CYG60_01050 [Actinobacteria bacterium]|nr:MAG: hypothetical protein CYG60_01050 [Actinomycetota bacterium]
MTPDGRGAGLSRREVLMGAAVAALGLPTWWLLARSGEEPPSGRPEQGAPAKHVILVDWDGFDPGYLGRAPTPNLDELAARGSLSVAEGTYQATSNPARASMSTGAYPQTHGNAAYHYDRGLGRAVGKTRYLVAETIAEALADEGKTTAAVEWYMVQDHGAAYGDPDHLYVEPDGAFERQVDVAVEILNLRPVDSGGEAVVVRKVPDFLAVYGPDLDRLGHREGAESPGIGPLLAEMDRQLGRLIRATEDVGIREETAFLLTSDHGMTTWKRPATEGLDAIARAGFRPEVVLPGRSPSAVTEVVVVLSSVRVADVTLLGSAATREGRERVRSALEGAPHVARVLDRDDLDALRAGDGLGDFVAEAEEPYGFSLEAPEGGASRGAHASTKEMRVPLLLSGAGVRPGARPRSPRLVDVAPTVAALLGARPPADAQGRALTESLDG